VLAMVASVAPVGRRVPRSYREISWRVTVGAAGRGAHRGGEFALAKWSWAEVRRG
jgi:hypothetical protein